MYEILFKYFLMLKLLYIIIMKNEKDSYLLKI